MKKSFFSQSFFVFLVCAAVTWSLAPFFWQVVTSLKTTQEILAVPPIYWPSHVTLASYVRIFRARPFSTYIFNSILIGLSATFLCVLFGAMAAYAFSRLRVRGGKWAYRTIMFVSLFPPTLLVVPLYKLIQNLGLLNNPLGLIIPYTALNLPFAIWVLTSFFNQIPRELEEAAMVDGLSTWEMLWKIFVPLSAPAMATAGILTFIMCWNEFLLAVTFMSRDLARTVPVGIAMLAGATSYEVPWDQISAAVVITTLPVVVVVLMFQRRIVEGLTAGAVKG